MYSVQLFFILLSLSVSAYGLDVEDIFPQDLIRQAKISAHHEDFGLDIVRFLEKYGYPLESHKVTTEDGYILTLHRIPYGRNESDLMATSAAKPAVFLQHGLLSSGVDWVNMGPDVALGLILADSGYDVWLGNNRGTTWSRKHISLNPDNDTDFWNYSFDDCGNYDLPADIDYILNITGNEKVNYIGHSQGTTQFFAMAALRPEYNAKINLMTALAPIAYMQNMSQPLFKFIAKYTPLFDLVMDELGIHEFLPHTQFLMEVVQILCHNGSDFQEICAGFLFFICGADSPQLDRSFLEVIATNAPAGASVKMLSHYLQEIDSGHFRRYDYGLENLAIYKSVSPPDYEISSMTAPIALFYAKNDALAAIVNVEQFADELPNLVEKNLVEYELFNHLDFIWATDVKTLLNDDVLALLNKHNFDS